MRPSGGACSSVWQPTLTAGEVTWLVILTLHVRRLYILFLMPPLCIPNPLRAAIVLIAVVPPYVVQWTFTSQLSLRLSLCKLLCTQGSRSGKQQAAHGIPTHCACAGLQDVRWDFTPPEDPAAPSPSCPVAPSPAVSLTLGLGRFQPSVTVAAGVRTS